ncbi:MAG: thioesterase [Desulfobacterales bacterium]|nr:MAG: thioesterase [Desulfobacterales bacterium]
MDAVSRRTHEIRLTVPFHDLDPMHIVWHGNYLRYFDQARFALFAAAGVDLYRYSVKNEILFPLIRTATKHIIPLRHNDDIAVSATVMDADIKITLHFAIRRLTDGAVCARGSGDQVAVKLPGMETLYEIPDDIRKALLP